MPHLPSDRELDDEIRGHLALSIKERVERGEDPAAARLAALRELGYLPAVREEMRRVWYSRWFDAVGALVQDIRVGLRSLRRAKGLAVAVVITLALGIGANAAIFSVVRGVLLRPLVNRGEDQLVYIRQSAPGLGAPNLTFSVPEINDLRARLTTVSALGEFSTVEFNLIGLGEPRVVRAGVVNGEYFEVMGLRPVLGRLLTTSDDGPQADGAAVLTHRFWTTSLNSDPTVVGKTVRLGTRTATVVGVLEPSVPYPADTEIIANIVTSPHHLEATMMTLRTHRMTELFGRLRPDATLDAARAEVAAAYDAIRREHPAAYEDNAQMSVSVSRLRDQIASPARPVLMVLLAAAAVVFLIACSNVANLILARSVRREGELAVRAALGASSGALRRTLLAESLVLCAAGAALGIALARPMLAGVAQFAARFSVRALDVTVDDTLLWVGAVLAIGAAVLLAFVPTLPSTHAPGGFGLAAGSIRLTPSTNRRLRAFAVAQIAFSFVLLAGAGTLLAALMALQTAQTGYNMHQVLAIDLPTPTLGISSSKEMALYGEIVRRVEALPGVTRVALGNVVPWRDAGKFGGTSGASYAAEGSARGTGGEEQLRARFRIVSPGFFDTLGIPLRQGRDFTPDDRRGSELVVIVSESVARRLAETGSVLNRRLWWTEEYFGKPMPRRIVGVVADVDDEHVKSGPSPAVYHPVAQMGVAGRMFVHVDTDPYALVPAITKVIREMSADQPVERAAILEDIRAEVLAPERINALVFSGFAGVALLIAVVGVGGVLAFGVSARVREFGVRLAVGSPPRNLLFRVVSEGLTIVAIGIAAGIVGGYVFAAVAARYFTALQMPGNAAITMAATVMLVAAVIASLVPAARAARIDVLQALRAE